MDRFVIGALILVGVAILIIFGAAVYVCLRCQEEQVTIVDDIEEVRRIYSEHAHDPRLEVCYVLYLSREYMEITKIVTYELKPRNHKYKKKIREEIVKIDYFTNRRL